MSNDMLSDAEVKVRLALLSAAAKGGATDEGLGALVSRLAGEPMVEVQEVGRGPVQLKVRLVRSLGPRFEGGTILEFDVPPGHPKRYLEVDEEPHKVADRLRANGWPH